MKRISINDAKEMYGVCTDGANSLYAYYLREDGCVVDSAGDVRFETKQRCRKKSIDKQ